MTREQEAVLIVEDEERLASMYATALEDEYAVSVANSGEEALSAFDDEVNVVLLDRKMPGLSGREVLERLRDDGHDQPVAMLTAVAPDWDILEIGFDDYLNKPTDMSELSRLVERLMALGSLDNEVREYITRSVKQAAIEREKDPTALDDREDFAEFVEETTETSAELGDVTAELSPRETELVVETIARNLDSRAGGDDVFSA